MGGVGGGGICGWASMPSGCHAGMSIGSFVGGLNPKTKLLLRDMEDGEGKNFLANELIYATGNSVQRNTRQIS
jgi:hypothetical protein